MRVLCVIGAAAAHLRLDKLLEAVARARIHMRGDQA